MQETAKDTIGFLKRKYGAERRPIVVEETTVRTIYVPQDQTRGEFLSGQSMQKRLSKVSEVTARYIVDTDEARDSLGQLTSRQRAYIVALLHEKKYDKLFAMLDMHLDRNNTHTR